MGYENTSCPEISRRCSRKSFPGGRCFGDGDLAVLGGDLAFLDDDRAFLYDDLAFFDDDLAFIGVHLAFFSGDLPFLGGDLAFFSDDLAILSSDLAFRSGERTITSEVKTQELALSRWAAERVFVSVCLRQMNPNFSASGSVSKPPI